MRAGSFQSSLLPLRSAVLAALGFTSLAACGGATSEPGANSGGDGGASSGGGTSTGGAGTGGIRATGGVPATGGVVGSGGTSTGGTGAGGLPGLSCTSGSAGELPDPADTYGFEPCRGAVHRPYKARCPSFLPRSAPTAACENAVADPNLKICRTDADCGHVQNGFCEMAGEPFARCGCWSGCREDSDCGEGMLCLCGDPIGKCVSATCTLDSECGPGLACTSYGIQPACPYTSFACQTAKDVCVSSLDCPAGLTCMPGADGRQCVANSCPPVGRPFLVGGAARVASVAARSDWCSELSPSLDGLDAAARAALAAAWTDVALMEHASIAAFARFALELLSLGAPPDLVEATHAAIADETVHARDAFALASAYGGRRIGPGALPEAADALLGRTPADIVRTAILEGCVGETVAAAEATEALAVASEPAVREALVKVVADETRHAQLAWRFVQWVVENDVAGLGDEAADALAQVVRAELAGVGAVPAERGDAATLGAHGVLPEALRAEIRRRVVRDVVAPAVDALVRARAPRSHRPTHELRTLQP